MPDRPRKPTSPQRPGDRSKSSVRKTGPVGAKKGKPASGAKPPASRTGMLKAAPAPKMNAPARKTGIIKKSTAPIKKKTASGTVSGAPAAGKGVDRGSGSGGRKLRSNTPSGRAKKKSTSSSGMKAAKGSDRKRGGGGGGRGGSGRKSKGGIGLAIKFSVPVCILLLLVIVVWGFKMTSNTSEMVVNGIKKDGLSAIKTLDLIGRNIVRAYNSAGTNWKDEKFWPVELGLISDARFRERMEPPTPNGAPADTNHFNSGVNNAELLHDLSFLGNKTSGETQTQVLSAFITVNGKFVAGTHKATGTLIDKKNWMSVSTALTEVRIGDSSIDIKQAEGIDVMQAIITQSGRTQKALVFEKAIGGGGNAIVALSAEVISEEIGSLKSSMYMIGGFAMLLAIGICVGIAAWVTGPVKTLIRDMNIVAGGKLEHRTRAHSNDEIGQVAMEFNEMTHKLLIARDAEKEAERLENELDMAREIQMKLLPLRVPSVTGFDTHAIYRPAKEVGGDYYDFLPIGIKDPRTKDCLGMIVADVSGKSIPGAMQMATTRTVLRFVASGNTSSADTLAKTNAIVAADIKRGMFVTAFYIVLNARKRTLLCSSAGHNPMVVVHKDGKIDLVNPNGIALGFDKGPIFQRTIKEEQIQLQQGDRVVLYTDGVVEAMDIHNEEYTDERFYEFCKVNADLNSKQFIQALLVDLDKHKGKAEQHDDITVVTFKVL